MRLSVEILQLQNIAIVWHYLRDPTFSRFYTIPSVTDTHTHRQTDGQIHDDGMHCTWHSVAR